MRERLDSDPQKIQGPDTALGVGVISSAKTHPVPDAVTDGRGALHLAPKSEEQVCEPGESSAGLRVPTWRNTSVPESSRGHGAA